MLPCVRGRVTLMFYMHFARGDCALRAAAPNFLVLYALRAREMRPGVRGCPTWRLYTHCARGGSAPARADAKLVGIIRSACADAKRS